MIKYLDIIIKNISEFNIKYNNQIGKFIYLMNIQKNKIYQKLNQYQTSFKDFLNHKTKKKKLIHVFINKYNDFFEKSNFFESEKAINEFNTDIEEISSDLWLLINEKEKNSIQELNNYKNEGFMQKELEKFHFNIKEIFLIETEKFLKMIYSIINLYLLETNNNNKNINEIRKLLEELMDANIIFKNISTIIIKDMDIDALIFEIISNINIMFENGIYIVFSFENIISKLIEEIKYIVMLQSKKSAKKSVRLNPNSNNNSMLSGFGSNNQPIHEKILQIIQNEKDKYKYRILYLKYFSQKYITIISQTFQDIYNNLDQWIITSISLQNDALNSVVALFKSKLNNHQLINEEKDIDVIEMDEFEKDGDNNEEIEGDISLKPIDNSSVIGGRVYNRLNIDYLIKDYFMDIKVEEINSNENKIYKMILPNEFEKKHLNEIDFYFDLNKYNEIYLKTKKYEIEPNIISKDLFYEIFLKQYCIDKYDEYNCEENKEDKNGNKSSKKKKIKTKKELVSTEEDEKEINNLNNKQEINLNNLSGICHALKIINTKQQSKIYSLYKINTVHKNIKKEENNNTENEKEEKKEYELYLNSKEIFTIFALIGCKVLNTIEEENIFKDLKDKFISEKYLSRKDFFEYNFWFEKDLEYQSRLVKQDEIVSKKSRKNINKIHIKDFLFNLWKDENGNRIDFEKLINILKINRYMTDINGFKDERYYNLIFEA